MNFLKAIFGGSTNSLSAGEAKELIGGGKPPFILDVRQPDIEDKREIGRAHV